MSRAFKGRATFNKFVWLKVLQSDTALPDTAFRLGVAICTTFTRADGTGWAFGLDELAAKIGRTLAQNTVKGAVGQLVSHGYVNETYRSQGGRGCRWRAAFDLKPVRLNVRVSAAPARSDGRVTGGNPHVAASEPARLNVETRTSRRTKNRLDQRIVPTTGTSSETSTGGACPREASPTPEPDPFDNDPPEDQSAIEDEPKAAAATAAPPDLAALPLPLIHRPDDPEPEPPERCPVHTDWDTARQGRVPNCGYCGDARQAHAAWRARYARWRSERADVRRRWIAACGECDSEGWVLDPWDELPVAMKCYHPSNWAVWWQAQQARPRCAAHTRGPLVDGLGCPDCARTSTARHLRAS